MEVALLNFAIARMQQTQSTENKTSDHHLCFRQKIEENMLLIILWR